MADAGLAWFESPVVMPSNGNDRYALPHNPRLLLFLSPLIKDFEDESSTRDVYTRERLPIEVECARCSVGDVCIYVFAVPTCSSRTCAATASS
eukprot:19427-Eustigmatos_ZCMA.PRE.1